jgi:putative ABC transport system permease protein
MLLAIVGGGAGWLLAKWVFSALVGVGTASLPRASEIRLDMRVLIFTAATAGLTGIMFGLAPAWRAGSVSLRQSLKETEHGLTAGRQRSRGLLVITETALALVLLVGAGLLLRSYYQLSQVNAGFAYDHLLSFSVSLPTGKYPGPEQRTEFFSNLTRKVGSLPGVQSVGLASGLPFGNSGWRVPFVVEGGTSLAPGEVQLLEGCVVSPGYFRTMGIPLYSGRYFTEQDNRQHLAGRDLSRLDEGARAVAGLNTIIIDEDFARRYWPGEDAVGKHIRLAPVAADSPLLTVVGVLGRVKMDRLSVESNRVQGYFSALQMPFSNMTVLIKSQLESTQITAAVRQQVLSVDPLQPIYNIRTIEEIRSNSIAPERLNVTLLGLFALLALTMSAVGLCGVVTYSVTQRTHEIGVRMALGAPTSHILKLVVGQGMKLAAIGLTIGLLISVVLTRMLRSLLFGISTSDPLTYAGVAGLLALVALLACYLPARRATKVNPLVALRNE